VEGHEFFTQERTLTKHCWKKAFFEYEFYAKTGLLLLVCLQLLATVNCGGGASLGGSPARRLQEGTVSQTVNPLVAQYTISPPAQSTVAIQFGTNRTYPFTTSAQPASSDGSALTFLVAGMKQNTLYHMRAVASYADGSQQFDSDHTFQTGSIPPDRMPQVAVTNPNHLTPAPGVELLSLTKGTANHLMALALDPSGNVIWYYDYDSSLGLPQPIKLLPNGHMLAVFATGGGYTGTVREFDLAGNIVRQFDFSDLRQILANAGYNISVISIDHDILLLPNGHLIVLITDSRVFTNLIGYPGDTTVLGNAVIDLDQNNNPVWVWDAFDHLDVNRHPMGFPDWTHANALFYCPDDGNLTISLRHQHWVLKLDYQNGQGSGDVLWKLGHQGDFRLGSGAPANWFYAQHDANIVSPNTTGDVQMAVFDNGNNRVLDSGGTTCGSEGAPPCYSRAAIFEVNENTRTANVAWAYTLPYSFWGGVTQLLDNSDIFVDVTTPEDNPTGARVLELTQGPNPKIVWQLDVNGQNSYRTIHLPSLYPGVRW
jgi:arylsulfate sulfotransferase